MHTYLEMWYLPVLLFPISIIKCPYLFLEISEVFEYDVKIISISLGS